MKAIEAETCGLLGRLQFNVQAIIGFARICTGDVFEVSIKHGHQRWRTRGKTQPDKTQRWDLQPPIASIHVLWNVPITVRVLEIGFLRAHCLNERQFDPAKFAVAQPQLVTMNLNNSGSLKLRLIVTWIPLINSNPSQLHHSLQLNQTKINNVYPNEKQNSSLQRSEPFSQNSALNGNKLRQHQSQIVVNNNQKRQQQNGSIWRTTSSNSPSSFYLQQTTNNNKTCNKNEQKTNGILKTNDIQSEQSPSSLSSTILVENGPTTKVCLRDKKRQREQRLKLGASVGAALGGISRESSKTEKDKWRCSSTTLLDDVYKDLSKSIPTIDDLSALHSSKSGSICGGSLGHSNAFGGPSSSSSISEGRGGGGSRSGGAKRIFSFVKRGNDKSTDKMTASDWRKSVSLAQIPQSKSLEIEQNSLTKNKRKEVYELEEPEEFNENEEKKKELNQKMFILLNHLMQHLIPNNAILLIIKLMKQKKSLKVLFKQ
ncbi:hypothetical protein Mgra_00000255 [Meloidogyne graminicola]|uniref:FAM65 N-terminal domain-containing protein n=1 Tax=Meloidogyne graminicola TaxID=189291 RepID=A0A8T0A2S5_9BILA|nr:hypothetical protein Mgra_00000255 [Meloidogyne graminicola]